VVQKGKEKEVEAVFEKWDLHCAVIGEVTDNGILEYYMNGDAASPPEPAKWVGLSRRQDSPGNQPTRFGGRQERKDP